MAEPGVDTGAEAGRPSEATPAERPNLTTVGPDAAENFTTRIEGDVTTAMNSLATEGLTNNTQTAAEPTPDDATATEPPGLDKSLIDIPKPDDNLPVEELNKVAGTSSEKPILPEAEKQRNRDLYMARIGSSLANAGIDVNSLVGKEIIDRVSADPERAILIISTVGRTINQLQQTEEALGLPSGELVRSFLDSAINSTRKSSEQPRTDNSTPEQGKNLTAFIVELLIALTKAFLSIKRTGKGGAINQTAPPVKGS